MEFRHETPATRVRFGAGVRRDTAAELDRLGLSRTLLLHSPSASAPVAEIDERLGGRVAGRFADTAMHVPVEVAQAALAAARTAGADSITAIGGGSAIGAAKAVAKESGLPIVAIPTTYSGSEMTSMWGLTEAGQKTTGRDPRVLPVAVLYDPELTLTLSPAASAASGMNALAHLVEALYAPAVSPITMLTAEEGVRALARALPRVVGRPEDLEARSEALYGAWLAGWSVGTTTMGVHHKICHVLGGRFGTPHAETHSAVLPYATAYNTVAAPQAMAAIVRALGATGGRADHAAGGLWDLATRIGAPTSLRALGFDPAGIDPVAAEVVAARPTNPRTPDDAGIRALLAAAVDGHRPSPTDTP